MDANNKIIDFFSLIRSHQYLKNCLEQFKNRSDLRELIWKSELREVTGDKRIYDDLLNISYDLILEALNTQNSNELVYESLLLLSIENFTIDYRDSLIRLAIINHVAMKKKMDNHALLTFIQKYSSEKAMKYYQNFFSQTKAERSLKAMGLREVVIDNKLKIEEIPPPWEK